MKKCEPGSKEGGAYVDPHMNMWNGMAYDCQRPGEFVLARIEGGPTIQARHVKTDPQTSVIKALALSAGTSTVSIYPGANAPRVVVNHTAESLGAGVPRRIGDDILMVRNGEYIGITLLNFNMFVVVETHSTWLNLSVLLPADFARTADGLFGRLVNNEFRGLRSRSGNLQLDTSQRVTFANLQSVIDSWSVGTRAESLFEYEPGESFGGFNDLTVPTQYTKPSDLTDAERTRGEGPCKAIPGLEGKKMFDLCVFDVVHGGDELATGYRSLAFEPATFIGVD